MSVMDLIVPFLGRSQPLTLGKSSSFLSWTKGCSSHLEVAANEKLASHDCGGSSTAIYTTEKSSKVDRALRCEEFRNLFVLENMGDFVGHSGAFWWGYLPRDIDPKLHSTKEENVLEGLGIVSWSVKSSYSLSSTDTYEPLGESTKSTMA